MTLNEAIDRNKELRGELVREGRLEKAAAVTQGIEALKRIQAGRVAGHILWEDTLPGETEEKGGK